MIRKFSKSYTILQNSGQLYISLQEEMIKIIKININIIKTFVIFHLINFWEKQGENPYSIYADIMFLPWTVFYVEILLFLLVISFTI